MSYGETEDTGIPTRAIHEAYLDMQRARKEYRQAKDVGDGPGLDRAHGQVQEAVLTFYELLRPHLRSNATVRGYYEGQLPRYDGNGTPPDPEDGKGVLQVQKQWDQVEFGERDIEAIKTDPPQTLQQWHTFLGLNGNTRVAGVRGGGEHVTCKLQFYELGLKNLDDWGTDFKTVQTTLDGFYGSKTTNETKRERVEIGRLQTAARELADVAEQLGFLSDTGTPTNDDTRPV